MTTPVVPQLGPHGRCHVVDAAAGVEVVLEETHRTWPEEPRPCGADGPAEELELGPHRARVATCASGEIVVLVEHEDGLVARASMRSSRREARERGLATVRTLRARPAGPRTGATRVELPGDTGVLRVPREIIVERRSTMHAPLVEMFESTPLGEDPPWRVWFTLDEALAVGDRACTLRIGADTVSGRGVSRDGSTTCAASLRYRDPPHTVVIGWTAEEPDPRGALELLRRAQVELPPRRRQARDLSSAWLAYASLASALVLLAAVAYLRGKRASHPRP